MNNTLEEQFMRMMEDMWVKFVDVTPDFDLLYIDEEILSNLT